MINNTLFDLYKDVGISLVLDCLLDCLDSPEPDEEVRRWIYLFLWDQRSNLLETIEYAIKEGGFETTIRELQEKVDRIGMILEAWDHRRMDYR